MHHWYRLDEHKNVIPIEGGMMEVIFQAEEVLKDVEGRIVEQTEIGNTKISTVFLSLDHAFRPGPPMVFETMIFSEDKITEKLDQIPYRCSTWQQAVKQHAMWVERVAEFYPDVKPVTTFSNAQE